MNETIQNIIILVLAVFALWGAFDYIVESLRIFRRSLRRYRDRNRD
jgi:fumarate reductase subunit D